MKIVFIKNAPDEFGALDHLLLAHYTGAYEERE
jgi:hypothetical protein